MAKPQKISMADRVKQRAKEAEYTGGSTVVRMKDGISWWKPKKGKNSIVVVPFTMTGPNIEEVASGDQWFRLQFLKHNNIGPDNVGVVCPRSVGKKCPICEHRAALIAQGRDNKDAEVQALNAKKRDLFYVLDINDDEDKLLLWEASYYNFGKKLEEEIREADAEGNDFPAMFADPEDGGILEIRMVEATMGKGKPFLEAGRIDFVERGGALGDDILEQAHPLNELLIIPTYAELKKLFYDLDGDPEEETEEATQATTARAKGGSRFGGSKKLAKPVEEEAEEETGEPEEEAEAPAKPASKRFGGAKKPAAAEPEEDTEEEEQTKPAHKKPASKADAAKAPAKPAAKPGAKKPAAKDSEGECPHGGTWGTSCDELDACEQCDVWAECRDAADDMNNK